MRHLIHDLLAPLPGTARQIHSFHFGPEQAKGKVYIQSSLHADELPGMLVARTSNGWPSWKPPAACAAKSCWCRWPIRSASSKC